MTTGLHCGGLQPVVNMLKLERQLAFIFYLTSKVKIKIEGKMKLKVKFLDQVHPQSTFRRGGGVEPLFFFY